jgi:hypothetical protein
LRKTTSSFNLFWRAVSLARWVSLPPPAADVRLTSPPSSTTSVSAQNTHREVRMLTQRHQAPRGTRTFSGDVLTRGTHCSVRDYGCPRHSLLSLLDLAGCLLRLDFLVMTRGHIQTKSTNRYKYSLRQGQSEVITVGGPRLTTLIVHSSCTLTAAAPSSVFFSKKWKYACSSIWVYSSWDACTPK